MDKYKWHEKRKDYNVLERGLYTLGVAPKIQYKRASNPFIITKKHDLIEFKSNRKMLEYARKKKIPKNKRFTISYLTRLAYR